MKIVFCLNYFLPGKVAGTEVYTLTLAKELMNAGHATAVIIPHYNSNISANYEYENIPVYAYAEPDVADRSLIKGERPPQGLKNFTQLVKELKPDIVHFMELEAGQGIWLYHIEAVKQAGFKAVITFHLSHYSCFTGTLMYKNKELCDGIINENKCTACINAVSKKRWQGSLLNAGSSFLYTLGINTNKIPSGIGTALGMHYIIKQKRERLFKIAGNCDQVFVLTDWYAQILKKNGVTGNKVTVIKQGLPIELSSNNLYALAETIPLKLIFAGRISEFKGVHLLVEALKQLDETKVSLDIYGQGNNGQYEQSLRKTTASLQNIQWKGKAEISAITRIMQQYHALCLPSTFSEMSPLVIQEAFAAGIPVIASNVYGNAEQVKHNYNGLLFEFNKADSLAVQIKRLSEEPGLLNELKKNILPPRSFNKVMQEYMAVYNQLLN